MLTSQHLHEVGAKDELVSHPWRVLGKVVDQSQLGAFCWQYQRHYKQTYAEESPKLGVVGCMGRRPRGLQPVIVKYKCLAF